MKKLLSAVTSLTMGLSLMTSVFASSFSVSAAGSLSAEQPNVAMSDAIDGTANKNASSDIVLDWKYANSENGYDSNGDGVNDSYFGNAGDTIYADMTIDANGNAVMGVDIGLTLTGDLFDAVTFVNKTSDAFGGAGLLPNWYGNTAADENPTDADGNEISAKITGALGHSEGSGDNMQYVPTVPTDGEVLTYLEIKIPADCPDGLYYIDFDYATITKDTSFTKYGVSFERAVIQVGNAVTTTTPDPSKDTPVIIDYKYEDGLDYYKATPGEVLYADMMIDTNGAAVMAIDMGLTIDGPLTFTDMAKTSEAFDKAGLVCNWMGNPANTQELVDKQGNPIDAKFNAPLGHKEGSEDTAVYVPTVPDTEQPLIWYEIDVPADIEPGTYYIDMAYIVLNKDSVPTPFTNITYERAKIVVESSDEEVIFDYKYPDGLDYYPATPGETIYADMTIDANGQAVMAIDMGLTIDEPLTFTDMAKKSDAFNGAGLVCNWMGNPANTEVLVDKNGNPIDAKFNAPLGTSVGEGDDVQYLPTVPTDGEVMIWYEINVPADIEPYFRTKGG